MKLKKSAYKKLRSCDFHHLQGEIRALWATGDNLTAQRQADTWFNISAQGSASAGAQGHPHSIAPPSRFLLGTFNRQGLGPAQLSVGKCSQGRSKHSRTVSLGALKETEFCFGSHMEIQDHENSFFQWWQYWVALSANSNRSFKNINF